MQMTPVESESVHSVGYDARSRVLRVAFRSGGTYEYVEVPFTCARQVLVTNRRASRPLTQTHGPLDGWRHVPPSSASADERARLGDLQGKRQSSENSWVGSDRRYGDMCGTVKATTPRSGA